MIPGLAQVYSTFLFLFILFYETSLLFLYFRLPSYSHIFIILFFSLAWPGLVLWEEKKGREEKKFPINISSLLSIKRLDEDEDDGETGRRGIMRLRE